MSIKLEEMLNEVRYPASINTAKDFTTTGATTTATLAVTSTSTFTGVATFTAAPVFSAGKTYQSVINGNAATLALTAAQSGSLVLFNRAAGCVATLPAPVVGLYYDFYTLTTITSGAAEVDTDAGTTFLAGTVLLSTEATTPSATAGPKTFTGNGTSHVKISSNGTTTGGVLGSFYRVACITSTQWLVSGILSASGTIATPFA